MALVPVGGVVELRCRVTRIDSFVRLSKTIPGTARQERLTTNMAKEHSIDGIDRYSITAQELTDNAHGYDFIFRITGTMYCILSYSVITRDKQFISRKKVKFYHSVIV